MPLARDSALDLEGRSSRPWQVIPFKTTLTLWGAASCWMVAARSHSDPRVQRDTPQLALFFLLPYGISCFCTWAWTMTLSRRLASCEATRAY
jgi:hypothetical protein